MLEVIVKHFTITQAILAKKSSVKSVGVKVKFKGRA
jgi:hypothetical protein